MQLNPDCVRDVLLTVEENSDYFNSVTYTKNKFDFYRLKHYSHGEILYHIRQCAMAGLLSGVQVYDEGDSVDIGDLSPDGHKFLANIRQDTIWDKTKIIAEKVGSKSLDAFIQISSNVITELIKAQFGLI